MTNKNSGFTLIEIILVMAVSGLLVVIALVGQHQLQARARFDAAMDKTIQDINLARNNALSQVNEPGPGNMTNIVQAGESIEFENQNIAQWGLTELEPIYASEGADAFPDLSTLGNWPPGLPNPSPTCPATQHPEGVWECFETFSNLPDDLKLSSVNDASIFFISTGHGLQICHDSNAGATTIVQACASSTTAPFTIDFQDSQGFTATIVVDGSTGYAKLQ